MRSKITGEPTQAKQPLPASKITGERSKAKTQIERTDLDITGTSLDITVPVRPRKKPKTQPKAPSIIGTSLDLTKPPSKAHRLQNAQEMVQAQFAGQPVPPPVYGPAPAPRIHGKRSQAKSMTTHEATSILQGQGPDRHRKKQLALRLPEPMLTALERICDATGITRTELITAAISEHIAKMAPSLKLYAPPA